ncbi:MAG: hypothetical protein NT018_07800 [Armatimonadetes bacterium]|nr:hypothetical protein [Armatimonadota bacterium]
MARQYGEDQAQIVPAEADWFRVWFEELAKRPRSLSIDIGNLEAGGNISVVIHLDEDNLSDTDYDFDKIRDAGCELPRCIIREVLTKDTARRLETAYMVINKHHDVNLEYSLGYIIFVWQISVGYISAKNGGPWLMCGPVVKDEANFRKLYPILKDRPAITLDVLLSFWEDYGLRHCDFMKRSDDYGLYDFRKIPPIWIDLHEYKEIIDSAKPPSRRNISVDANIAPFVEVLQQLYAVGKQTIGTINLSFSQGYSEGQEGPDLTETQKPTLENSLSSPIDPNEKIFCNYGATWLVSYDGIRKTVPNKAGMHYIEYLLTNPNKDMDVLKLANIVNRITATGHPMCSQMTSEQLNEEGLSICNDFHDQVTDKAAMIHIHKETIVKLGMAWRRKDFDDVAKLTGDIEYIDDQIKKCRGLGGSSKKNTAAEKPRVNIQKAIKSACDEIKKVHKPLYHHLKSCIRTGYILKYEPGQKVRWDN